MDIITLAQTQPKDSYSESGLKFYKQYAIGRNLSSDEKNNLYESYRLTDVYKWDNPVVTLRRRVDNIQGKISYWEWEYFDIFESDESASNGFGDSEYWKSENGVHPLHIQAVERAQKMESLRDEYESLEKQIIGGKFGSSAELKQKYNDLYESELKTRRLWSKVKKGIAPQDVLDEIKNRLMPLYEAEKLAAENRMNEIKKELETF